MKQTPLNQKHKQLGARMVDFAGWEMPVFYPTGALVEHEAVRTGVGLFDISHMGEILVEGARAQEFINFIGTNNITKISDGACQYSVCCYENGTVVDDIISYQISPQKYFVVVNASNTEKDFEWFQKHNSFGVSIKNVSPEYCQLALQGPKAVEVMKVLGNSDITSLKSFRFLQTKLCNEPVIVSRTGYTGEDGFEIYGPWGKAEFLWDQILEAGKSFGIKPIGLAARDTLRFESCYSLYGHEISDSINPLEANLAWVVKLDKAGFVGKDALAQIAQKGPGRKLVGLSVEKGIAREGFEVVSQTGEKIGFVTSGTFSPTYKKPLAMALVNKDYALGQSEISVLIRGQAQKAKIVSMPFYHRYKP